MTELALQPTVSTWTSLYIGNAGLTTLHAQCDKWPDDGTLCAETGPRSARLWIQPSSCPACYVRLHPHSDAPSCDSYAAPPPEEPRMGIRKRNECANNTLSGHMWMTPTHMWTDYIMTMPPAPRTLDVRTPLHQVTCG